MQKITILFTAKSTFCWKQAKDVPKNITTLPSTSTLFLMLKFAGCTQQSLVSDKGLNQLRKGSVRQTEIRGITFFTQLYQFVKWQNLAENNVRLRRCRIEGIELTERDLFQHAEQM